jgi:copper(I)-binding protein
MLLVAVVLGILAFVFRAKPVATGSIDEAFAATVPNQNNSLAVVTLNFQNVTEKPLRLININVAVHAKDSDFSDDFASVADFPRYFQAVPELEQHTRPGLVRDSKFAPMEYAKGSVIVAFPLTPEEFNARDSLTVTLRFEDHPPVKITSKKG